MIEPFQVLYEKPSECSRAIGLIVGPGHSKTRKLTNAKMFHLQAKLWRSSNSQYC